MSRKSQVPIVLPADPVNALEAATKQYVDAKGITLPVGVVVDWDSDDPIPTNWIEANGAAFNPATYPALANIYEDNKTPARCDIPRFASVAERDSLWPVANAPTGAFCVTVDTGTLWQSVAGSWQDPRPRGLIAWRQGYRSGFAITSTPQEVYKITTTLVAGRAYRWSFTVRAATASSTPNHARVQGSSTPTLPGSVIDAYFLANQAAGIYNNWCYVGRFVPTVTQSYAIVVNVSCPTTGVTLYAEFEGCSMIIEDIGLAVADSSG